MTTPILLDADPGIDDALAIALAAGDPRIELAGITTVNGNVGLDLTTQNAMKVRGFIGQNCPVVPGAATPLVREAVLADDVHGAIGLGHASLPEPTEDVEKRSAPQFIVDTIRATPGQITLVAIGPLTNIALAVSLDPGIVDLVADFVIMGGAATVPGNITPAAEFNIGVDPEAAKIVFDAGWTLTMIGLDATRASAAGPQELEAMSRFGPLSDELLIPCLSFYRNELGRFAIHDACAVAHVAHNNLLTLDPARVEIEIDGRWTAGMTVTDFRASADRHNAYVATMIDSTKLWEVMDDAYQRLSAEIPSQRV